MKNIFSFRENGTLFIIFKTNTGTTINNNFDQNDKKLLSQSQFNLTQVSF